MVKRLVAAGAVVAVVACQGQGPPVGGGSARVEPAGSDATGAPAPSSTDAAIAVEPDAQPHADDAEPLGPERVIADLGAIPAWQAVVDRAQLLARRRQHSVVYGRVGPAILVPGAAPAAPEPTDAGVAADAGAAPDAGLVASPYVWLIDDTEGNGALAIRVALGDKAHEGNRIAAGGAWQLDTERRWHWKPDAVQPLPPGSPSDLKDPPAAPGHATATGALPVGARTISVAHDGDLAYFQIVGPAPITDGDGWLVADQLGSPAIALMTLPGERASYGGQDMSSPDERWQLRRGQTYWVRLGKFRKRSPDKPPVVAARTAPVRIP